MSELNVFELAVSNKFRYPYKGIISTEDLYDLSVKELDSIFMVLNSQLKQTKEESLLGVKSKEDKELEVKIEIIKYIVKIKLDEQERKLKEKEVKIQKQKILTVLAKKEDESLENKTPEELKQMLETL